MGSVPEDLLAPLTLVVGEEELLVSRAVSEVLQAARAADPETEVHDLVSAELQRGDVDEALTPSLFGGRRVVVLRAVQDLPKDLTDELLAAARDVPDQTSVVVVHAGGAKGKALVQSLTAIRPRRVDVPKVSKASERREFVRRELRRDGRQVDEDAVPQLIEAVGTDLRQLASAAGQLLVDTSGPITADAVARYHRGTAPLEFQTFAIADRVVEGDLTGALELLRWGESTGMRLTGVTSALASTLRSMALVASSAGVPAAQLAGALGMPPWKVDRTRRQVRGWHPDGLVAALRAVAQADADVKGAAANQEWAVERALISVAGARGGRS